MALNLNFLFQLHMGRNEEAGEHFNIYEKHMKLVSPRRQAQD